jgi:hypothetical protein
VEEECGKDFENVDKFEGYRWNIYVLELFQRMPGDGDRWNAIIYLTERNSITNDSLKADI